MKVYSLQSSIALKNEGGWLLILHFNNGEYISDEVFCLSRGPAKDTQFFASVIHQGRHFRISEQDKNKKITYDQVLWRILTWT